MNTPNNEIDYVKEYGLVKEVREDRTTADLLGILDIPDRCAKDEELALQYMNQNFAMSLEDYAEYEPEGFGLSYKTLPPFVDLKRKNYNPGDHIGIEELMKDDPEAENFATVGQYLKHILENYPPKDVSFSRATQQRRGVFYRFSVEEILDQIR